MRQAVDGIEDPVGQTEAVLRADLKTREQCQDEILPIYQETKSLGRASRRAVLSREAGYVQFFGDVVRAGYGRGAFTDAPRLSADLIAYVCSVLALRPWDLRARFSSDEVHDGLIRFILSALGIAREEPR